MLLRRCGLGSMRYPKDIKSFYWTPIRPMIWRRPISITESLDPGSRADALHVALASVGGADVLVSWNFKHVVNLGKIRSFNAVNLEQGYGLIEIRTPKEVLSDEKEIF